MIWCICIKITKKCTNTEFYTRSKVYFKTYILILVPLITTYQTKQSKDIYQPYKNQFLDNFQILSIVIFYTLWDISKSYNWQSLAL